MGCHPMLQYLHQRAVPKTALLLQERGTHYDTMSNSNTQETEQITTFNDDVTVISTTYDHVVPTTSKPGAYAHDHDESRIHTVMDVLSRPQVVARFTVTPTATEPSFTSDVPLLHESTYPSAFFSSSADVVRKLTGFSYLRATVCFRLIVSASPFHSGIFWFFSDYFRTALRTADHTRVSAHMAAITCLNGVEFNINTMSAAELRVPYVSPYSAWNLITPKFDTITASMVALSPTFGPGDLGFTLYSWLEDITVSIPTSVPMSNSWISSAMRAKTRFTGMTRSELLTLIDDAEAHGLLEAQVGEAAAVNRDISNAAYKVAGVVNIFNKIPILSSFLTPVKWFTDAFANAAYYLGYAKPTTTGATKEVLTRPGVHMSHALGQDNSISLSTSPANQVAHAANLFPTELDEMSYNFLATKKPLLRVKPWLKADLADHTIDTGLLNPYQFANVGGGALFCAPFSYLALQHKYWRGNFDFRFKVAKTAFHSGKLQFYFTPSSNSQTLSINSHYNIIWDLKDSDTLEISIPYTANREFLLTVDNPTLPSSYFGTWGLRVHTPLVAPETVAQTIHVLTFVSMSDSIFAVPCFRYIAQRPTTVLTTQSEPDEAQVGMLDKDDPCTTRDDSDCHCPMLFDKKTGSLQPTVVCIGEHVCSLRAMTRRSTPDMSFAANNNQAYRISPHYLNPRNRLDLLAQVSSLYRFQRGSIRHKFFNFGLTTAGLPNGTFYVQRYQPSMDVYDYHPAPVNGLGVSVDSPCVMQCTASNHVLEVSYPFAQATPFLINGLPINGEQPNTYVFGTSVTAKFTCCTSAGDDHTFAGFQGIPPMVYQNANLVMHTATRATSSVTTNPS